MKNFFLSHHKIFALLFFVGISLIYFGLGMVGHFSSYSSGTSATDVFGAIWCFAWWPHALIHHLNPFISQLIWAPSGFNLTKINAMPGLALLFMPITLVFGALFSYNMAAILIPAFAAWTAYLLMYYIFKSPLLSLVGSYFFGFSCYIISQMLGHLCLVAAAIPIPLFPLLILMHLNNEVSSKKFIFFYTLTLVFLYLFEIELFATFTFWGGISFLIALLVFKERRNSLIALLKPIFFSYLLAAACVSPFLYYFLTDHSMAVTMNSPSMYSADLLSLFVPSSLFLLTTDGLNQLYSTFTGNMAENSTYFNIFVMLIFLLFIKQFWKTALGKYLSLISLLFIVASFGPALHIAGISVFSFPWRFIFLNLPLLKNSLPIRLGLCASLTLAICLVFWLKYSPLSIYKRATLLVFAVLFLLPSFQQTARPTFTKRNDPAFFSTNLYQKYLTSKDTVLILPFGSTPELLWQAQNHFSFKLALGYLGAPPNDYVSDSTFGFLSQLSPGPLSKEKLAFFIYRHKITKIIIPWHQFYPSFDSSITHWNSLLLTLDKKPISVGGVTIYSVNKEKLANSFLPVCPTSFDFNYAPGTGWSGAEKQSNGGYAMWMDSKSANIILPSTCRGDIDIKLYVFGYLSKEVLDHLIISINNQILPFKQSITQDQHILLEGHTILNTNQTSNIIQLDLSVPRTIHVGGDDDRNLAIMFSKVEIRNNH